MRVGVVRGDMPGSIALMDLETVSQYNPPTEPRGQEIRIGRPTTASVEAVLADVPATIVGNVDLTGGVTITLATNDVLSLKLSAAASFTDATVAAAVYASGATFLVALNAALVAASLDVTATLNDDGFLVLTNNTAGVGSYLEYDSEAGGSTINTDVGLLVGGDSTEVPDASAVILASSPVGGPLDVSFATLAATVGSGLSTAMADTIANAIAPHIVETDVAIKSFQVGMMAGYRSASYNPDPNRFPAISDGAAIEVVADDGVTPFTAPLTVVSAAVHNSPNAGDITITGTNLGNSENNDTIVKVTSSNGATSVKLYQAVIASTVSGGTTGSVGATSIVLPASLLNSLGVAGSKVQVQYTSLASNLYTVT